MGHIGAGIFTVLREDRPYELKDTDGKSVSVLAARELIMTKYQVPEDIRQARRKSKGSKASTPRLRRKRGTAADREHEAAIAPQPVTSSPFPVT